MLNRLVADITKTLIELKHSKAERETIPDTQPGPPPSKLVYLAETTSDLADERELVRDELQQRGYSVLPEHKLPLEGVKQTQAAIRSDLGRCALCIHLVGARYGSTPEDDPRSVVRLQEELATERAAADPAFLRLIWMPPGLSTPALEISDERQKILHHPTSEPRYCRCGAVADQHRRLEDACY
jgi:hypothetical protein